MEIEDWTLIGSGLRTFDERGSCRAATARS